MAVFDVVSRTASTASSAIDARYCYVPLNVVVCVLICVLVTVVIEPRRNGGTDQNTLFGRGENGYE